MTSSDEFSLAQSAAEKKVLLLMRNLGPYDKIEIRLNEHKADEILIISTGTQKEVFPRSML